MSTARTAPTKPSKKPLPPGVNNTLSAWWLAIGLSVLTILGLGPLLGDSITNMLGKTIAGFDTTLIVLGAAAVVILLIGAFVAVPFAKGRRSALRLFKPAAMIGLLIGLGAAVGLVVISMDKLGPSDFMIFKALAFILVIVVPLLSAVFAGMGLSLVKGNDVREFFGLRCPECGSFKVVAGKKLKCREPDCGHVWPEPEAAVASEEEEAVVEEEAETEAVAEEDAVAEEPVDKTVMLSATDIAAPSSDALDAIFEEEGLLQDAEATKDEAAEAEAIPEAEGEEPALTPAEKTITPESTMSAEAAERALLDEWESPAAEDAEAVEAETEEETIAEEAEAIQEEEVSVGTEEEAAEEADVEAAPTKKPARKGKKRAKSPAMMLTLLWVLLGAGIAAALGAGFTGLFLVEPLVNRKGETTGAGWTVLSVAVGVLVMVGFLVSIVSVRRSRAAASKKAAEEAVVESEVEAATLAVEEEPEVAIEAEEEMPSETAAFDPEATLPTQDVAAPVVADVDSSEEESAETVALEEPAAEEAFVDETEVAAEEEPVVIEDEATAAAPPKGKAKAKKRPKRKSPALKVTIWWVLIVAVIIGMWLAEPFLASSLPVLTDRLGYTFTGWLVVGGVGAVLAILGLVATFIAIKRSRRVTASEPVVMTPEEPGIEAITEEPMTAEVDATDAPQELDTTISVESEEAPQELETTISVESEAASESAAPGSMEESAEEFAAEAPAEEILPPIAEDETPPSKPQRKAKKKSKGTSPALKLTVLWLFIIAVILGVYFAEEFFPPPLTKPSGFTTMGWGMVAGVAGVLGLLGLLVTIRSLRGRRPTPATSEEVIAEAPIEGAISPDISEEVIVEEAVIAEADADEYGDSEIEETLDDVSEAPEPTEPEPPPSKKKRNADRTD